MRKGAVSNKVWGVAMKTARDSTFAGYDDWRLPNLKEIQTFVDVSKNNPAQDTTLFPIQAMFLTTGLLH